MTSWITFVGTSPMAIVNSLWYAKEVYNVVPKKIYLLINSDLDKKLIELTKKEIKLVLPGSKLFEVLFKQTNMANITDKLLSIISKESPKDVIIDITAGRKFMSAIAMQMGFECKVSKVYYLHLHNDNYINKRYDEVPLIEMTLYDLMRANANN